MNKEELKFIEDSIEAIKCGTINKLEYSSNKIKVYKIPSNNPEKYTIRVDVKIAK